MNNKGQTLVFFIALLPFIFILFVFAIDLAKVSSENTFLEGVAEEAIRELFNNKTFDEVKTMIEKNDESIKINSIDNTSVCLEKEINPIFGGIINFDFYKVKTCMEGHYNNNKLVIAEKGK